MDLVHSVTYFPQWINDSNDDNDNLITTVKANNSKLNLTKQMLGDWLCLRTILEQY